MTSRRGAIACAAMVWLFVAGLCAQTRVDSPVNKHNLSASGPGPIKSTTMTEVCVFCHTPHNANPAVPLWNQTLSGGVTYQPYTSSTLQAAVGVPTGSSKLCLSCHDGTVAIGNTIRNGQIPMQGTVGGRIGGTSLIGTDLRPSHPISFVPLVTPEIVNPSNGSPVALDASGQVQCRSCHDPHIMDIDGTTKKFLVRNNSSSGLCLVCHQKQYWTTNPSTHSTSAKSYTATQGAHTGYTTVATNGCEQCHKPHGATVTQRGMKAVEELTCGSAGGQCHGTSGIGRNIQSEFSKAYVHPTYSVTPSVHDASESPTSLTFRLPEATAASPRHAECPDCHNAHSSYAAATTAPKGSGKISGVWGVSGSGTLVLPSGVPPSVNEYQICFRCHATSANMPQPTGTPAPPYPTRQAPQFNMALMFDSTAVSYHPVEAVGRNTFVPSLIAPWTTTSVMYCSDCHDNDTGPKAPTPGTGPSGPHGSNFKHLLAGRYDMDNGTYSESATIYALCYKCHSRTSILNDQSFDRHHTHISDENTPCSVCHDPHGISSSQGTPTNNFALINFDLRFVTPSSSGVLRFDHLGQARGRCYLTCHGRNHNPETYP